MFFKLFIQLYNHPWRCFCFPLQLDALCPAVDELTKLSTVPPAGHMAVLQAAAQVYFIVVLQVLLVSRHAQRLLLF